MFSVAPLSRRREEIWLPSAGMAGVSFFIPFIVLLVR